MQTAINVGVLKAHNLASSDTSESNLRQTVYSLVTELANTGRGKQVNLTLAKHILCYERCA